AASTPMAESPLATASAPAPISLAPSEPSLKQRLQALADTPGVRFVVLADREGFLIETAGELAPDADEVAGALASCLAEASDGIGRELGQGPLVGTRSEEHTSELQSRFDLVCRLLLEKKKKSIQHDSYVIILRWPRYS